MCMLRPRSPNTTRCSGIGVTPTPLPRHAGLNVAVGYEVLGKALLGVNEPISQMV
jgi:hypothetical protein